MKNKTKSPKYPRGISYSILFLGGSTSVHLGLTQGELQKTEVFSDMALTLNNANWRMISPRMHKTINSGYPGRVGDAHVYNIMVIHYVCTHTESNLDWWGLSLSTLQDCQNILQQAPL